MDCAKTKLNGLCKEEKLCLLRSAVIIAVIIALSVCLSISFCHNTYDFGLNAITTILHISQFSWLENCILDSHTLLT